jgi:hypothetical protein
MSDDTIQVLTIVVPGIIALVGGGGGVWTFMQARTTRLLGGKQHENERESVTVTGLKDLASMLRSEVDSLREDRDEDRAEMRALRDSQEEDRAFYIRGMNELTEKHEAVVEENRRFRVVILGVVDQLRRIPPPEHSEIRDFILSHLPWLGEEENR